MINNVLLLNGASPIKLNQGFERGNQINMFYLTSFITFPKVWFNKIYCQLKKIVVQIFCQVNYFFIIAPTEPSLKKLDDE